MNSTVSEVVLLDQDRTHAVLIVGHEGSDVASEASRLSQGWLCLGDDAPCLDCPACRSFTAGTCVDFQAIEPTGASRNILLKAIVPVDGDDPGDTIPLSMFFRTSPLMAKRKVVLIQDADRLNSRASNALLKMLEEPPPFAKFILTTGSVSRLAATVVSRCMTLFCALPVHSDLVKRFGDLTEIESLFGEGAPDRVAFVRGNSEVYVDLAKTFDKILSEPRGAAIRTAEQLRAHGEALGAKLGTGSRQGNAEVLRALGKWWVLRGPLHAEALGAIAASHRGILGNASAPAVFDALLVKLAGFREPERVHLS